MKLIIKPLGGLLFGIALSFPAFVWAQTPTGFHVLADYPIHSTGGWDYITADGSTGRVYASHGMQVNILNAATGDSVGIFPIPKACMVLPWLTGLTKGIPAMGAQTM